MDFKILTYTLLDDYTRAVKKSPLDKISKIEKANTPVDYFQFYKSVSSVYSSKIEGEDIDFDSFLNTSSLKSSSNLITPENRMIYMQLMILRNIIG